jgi:hypothetical protein
MDRSAGASNALGYTADPVTYTPLSSRGLGRRILSPETRVRIPVAVPQQSPADAGLFHFVGSAQRETLSRICPEICASETAALHGKGRFSSRRLAGA